MFESIRSDRGYICGAAIKIHRVHRRRHQPDCPFNYERTSQIELLKTLQARFSNAARGYF